jgi:hypothetical protein
MKNIIYLSSFIILLSFTQSYAQELPKDGAIISVKETAINITPGSQYETVVELIRSKRYQKADFGGLAVNAPEGLKISFEQDAENQDMYKMVLNASIDAEVKAYTIIVKGEGENSHKVKGVAVSINLTNDQIVISNN